MKPPENPDLRDYFAAQALVALLTQTTTNIPGMTYSEAVAATSYHMADAMLAERAKATI
jgi:hypothetical protein